MSADELRMRRGHAKEYYGQERSRVPVGATSSWGVPRVVSCALSQGQEVCAMSSLTLCVGVAVRWARLQVSVRSSSRESCIRWVI